MNGWHAQLLKILLLYVALTLNRCYVMCLWLSAVWSTQQRQNVTSSRRFAEHLGCLTTLCSATRRLALMMRLLRLP